MPRPTPSRFFRRQGNGYAGLIAAAVTALSVGGWVVWAKGNDDRDLERRWAIPREAKAIAEEEIALAPRRAGDLAEAEVKAAAHRYATAVEAIRADTDAEREQAADTARARFRAEMDAAHDKAERLVREWDAKNAARRLQLRADALALVAEWDALFARHPEWPQHRLTAEE